MQELKDHYKVQVSGFEIVLPVIALLSLSFALFLATCSSRVRYASSHKHASYQQQLSDLPENVQPLTDLAPSSYRSLSGDEREFWQTELQKARREVPKGTMEYDMYVAHCLGNLKEHEKSADYYLKAAKKAKDPKAKRKLRLAAVRAMGYAGRQAELNGDIEHALKLYKKCNTYCKRFGFEEHVPHSRMEELRKKAGRKSYPGENQ